MKKESKYDEFDRCVIESLPLMNYVANRITSFNKTEAEDLIQASIALAYKNKDKFKIGTNFKAWITVILRNRHRQNWRSNKLDFIEEIIITEPARQESKCDVLSLIDHIEKLPKEIGRLIYLKHFLEYSYEEISEETDLNVGTIKSKISRGLEKLRLDMKIK